MPAYPATRWSVVSRAAASTPQGRKAFDELCRIYWPALYAFARRAGLVAHDAEEAVQSFVLSLLEGDGLAGADPTRGRFRNYLCGAFRHHLSNLDARARAAKRGGHWQRLSADADALDQLIDRDDEAEVPVEDTFDRAWAWTLLQHTADAMTDDYRARGQGRLWAALLPQLTQVGAPPAAERLAALGVTRNAYNVALHRARKRFGDRLRTAVADTLIDPTDDAVAEEVRHLARLTTKMTLTV